MIKSLTLSVNRIWEKSRKKWVILGDFRGKHVGSGKTRAFAKMLEAP
jgi:hypothetical protein